MDIQEQDFLAVDQWFVEFLRSREYFGTYYTHMSQDVPEESENSHIWVQKSSGTEYAKTQVLEVFGEANFRIEMFGKDQAKLEKTFRAFKENLSELPLSDRGFLIEDRNISEPKVILGIKGLRLIFDIEIFYTRRSK